MWNAGRAGFSCFPNAPGQVFKGKKHQLCAAASYQGDPQDYVLVNKTVEVLVEEEETRPDEGCVGQVQLTLGHVGHLKKRER